MPVIAKFDHVTDQQYRRDASAFADAMALDALPLPRRATAGSAGYDFVCPAEVTIKPGDSVTIPTGVRALIQAGWVLVLLPRSSLGFKHELRLSNTAGVIDSDYAHADNEGHILVRLHNGGGHTVTLHAGDRFCQGLLLPFGLAEGDDAASERSGGLGSTGR